MGIVNVTPDSFSDGGRYLGHDAALAHARKLIADGADILDIGGESTRPGAEPVVEADEIARVVPLIAAIRAESAVPISIDTMKPADAPAVAAELGCEVILMHMLGEPRTMQDDPRYDDVVAEVEAFLLERPEAAIAAGVARDRIWLDPGIGFGKTLAHNLALMAALPRLGGHGFRVLLGASRKRFIAALDPLAGDAGNRLGGSIALALAGARAGVTAVRVHDVRETVQALAVQAAVNADAHRDAADV